MPPDSLYSFPAWSRQLVSMASDRGGDLTVSLDTNPQADANVRVEFSQFAGWDKEEMRVKKFLMFLRRNDARKVARYILAQTKGGI